MITTFTFVRHGQTDWNKKGIVQGSSDVPLNDSGIKQAYDKSSFFNGKVYDFAYSSPLRRAQKTLKILLSENDIELPIIKDERLMERRFGQAEGIHFMYNRSFKEQNIENKNFENNDELENRIQEFLVEKAKDHPNKSLLITAHSHLLKAAHRVVYQPQIDYSFPLDNLGVLIIEFNHQTNSWSIPYYEGKM